MAVVYGASQWLACQREAGYGGESVRRSMRPQSSGWRLLRGEKGAKRELGPRQCHKGQLAPFSCG